MKTRAKIRHAQRERTKGLRAAAAEAATPRVAELAKRRQEVAR